jgi:hypothetical protein
MTKNAPNEALPYEHLHAIVVDGSRYITAGQSVDDAANEVLQRLRDAGLPIPAKP